MRNPHRRINVDLPVPALPGQEDVFAACEQLKRMAELVGEDEAATSTAMGPQVTVRKVRVYRDITGQVRRQPRCGCFGLSTSWRPPPTNAFSYWLFLFGGLIVLGGFITPGGAADFG